MDTGMLWFDNDPRKDLNTKINLAADYYFKKYGRKPDLCFVHPSMLSAEPDQFDRGGSALQPHGNAQPFLDGLAVHLIKYFNIKLRTLEIGSRSSFVFISSSKDSRNSFRDGCEETRESSSG